MLSYPARLLPTDEGAVMLTLPDVPEVVLVGRDEDEAFAQAPAVLDAVLAGYVLERRPIPTPSDICGAPSVETDRFSLVGMD